MEAFAEALLKNIITGGPGAMISLLMGLCGLFGFQIFRLENLIAKKDARLNDVIDKNFDANYAIAESLNQLRAMIFELVKSR